MKRIFEMEPTNPLYPSNPEASNWKIEYHGPTDKYGKCSFTLFWTHDRSSNPPKKGDKGPNHAQGFFSDPVIHGYPRPEDLGLRF